MRRFAFATLVFGLIGAPLAYGQPQDDRHHGPGAGSAPPSHAPTPSTHRTMNAPGHPREDGSHSGPTLSNRPAVSITRRPAVGPSGPVHMAGGHHLPPGIAVPRTHHQAPVWRGRPWNIGDFFVLAGFRGPVIYDTGSYGLSLPRPGTHWIYVDGFFLMVGNRTGRIFAEIPADY